MNIPAFPTLYDMECYGTSLTCARVGASDVQSNSLLSISNPYAEERVNSAPLKGAKGREASSEPHLQVLTCFRRDRDFCKQIALWREWANSLLARPENCRFQLEASATALSQPTAF
jgi:hypothetical protein